MGPGEHVRFATANVAGILRNIVLVEFEENAHITRLPDCLGRRGNSVIHGIGGSCGSKSSPQKRRTRGSGRLDFGFS